MSEYDTRKDEILKDMSELLKIESITQDREKNKEALNWVIKKAEELSLRAGIAVDGEVAIITLGFGKWNNIKELKKLISISGKETLGILVHVDVVPAGEDWTIPPFEGTIKDGYLWGRGVVDDKGPLVLCLHAMAELAKTHNESELKRNALMVVGSREEDAWLDMDAFNDLGIKPDFGFTPDGEFPVSNREKGYIDVAFRFKRGDKDNGYILSGGSATNMIPATAQLIIKDVDGGQDKVLDFQGVASHSSKPENGVNAIVKMAEGLQNEELSETVKRLCGFLKESFKDFYGSGLNLNSGETVIGGEYFHRNVISPVLLKTYDDYYEIIANMRSTWGYDRKRVFEELNRNSNDWKTDIDVLESMDPTMISRDSELIKIIKKVYKSEVAGEFDFELAYGTSYAKAMPNIVAFGPIFPGGLDTCHQKDERMEMENFMKAGRIYWNVINDICG